MFTFGSNQWGALGAGDIATHHRLVRVRVPRASAIAAGSNHSAVLTRDGELYTFGSYQVLTLLRDSAHCLYSIDEDEVDAYIGRATSALSG